jgi:molybdopterin-guanine dinucleotide biosynthesis protein A
MGRPKLDILLGGSTFLQRVVAAACPVFDTVIAVQRSGGSVIEGVPTIFETPHEEQAPVFGVACALRQAREECFVLAIDYPLLTPGVLRYLCDRIARSSAPLVVPRWRGKLQMLCAGYSPSLLPRIETRIAARQLDLRGLADEGEIIEEHELRERFAGEPLMNVNTPEELEEAWGHFRGDPTWL